MDYGVETIKRRTRAVYGCMAAGQSPMSVCLDCGLGFTPAMSVTHNASAVAVCDLWRYIKCYAFAF